MADNSTRKADYRCAIFGTAGSFGKPRYSDSLELAKAAIDDLIKKGLYTFVTDGRDGFDLDLAVYIQKVKEENPNVHLVVVRPYPDFKSNWNTKPILRSVMDKADMVKYMAEKEEDYSPDELNGWILSHCNTVLYIKRSKDAQINRISDFDLTSKTVIYIPDMPREKRIATDPSKSEVYPINLIAAILNVDSENINLQEFPDDIEERLSIALENCLKEREVFVMEERFIEGKVLQEIGDSLDLSRERIRQLISKSLRRLRYYSKRNGLFTDVEVKEAGSGNNAGQKWTSEEEELLIERYNQGLPIEEIASLHGRGKGGIRSRLRKLGIDPDEISPASSEERPESELAPSNDSSEPGASYGGLNLNEIVVAAVQVPGHASFDNYDELKSYLRSGLETYNNTVYSLDNIDQARRDHFVLKNVRKKLSDTKKAIQKEYSLPIELVVQQLDELINMVNGPFSSLDRMLKINAKEIKRHDIMNYAQSKAYMLGKYANSVLQSPSFFNPKWCNASYSDSKWKKEIDSIFEEAKDSIEYILESNQDDLGIILGYYFDKLSLSGVDAFLNNVRKEEAKRQPETIFIDVNTGEIIEQAEEKTIEKSHDATDSTIEGISSNDSPGEIGMEVETADNEPQEPQKPYEAEPEQDILEPIVNKTVVLSGTKEQIDKYLAVAPQFNVSAEEIK